MSSRPALKHRLRRQLALGSLRLRRRALQGVFSALARLGDFAGGELRAARDSVDIIRNVPYGPHPVGHLLDIYRPRGVAGPLPVLLYIHGGAFVLCSKDTHRSLALLNAKRARYLVFNINYRLAPSHRFPAAVADACAAYRWVVRNCERYGGDPTRIVVAGESAGGNLALGVGVANAYRRPEAYARGVYDLKVPPAGVMPIMPYLQASDPMRRVGDPGVGYLALAVAKDIALAYLGGARPASDRILMADPVRVLEECGAPDRGFAPMFSGAGTADLCCADVRRLESVCDELGLPLQVAYFRDEGHAFHALHWRRAARRFWRKSVAFLRRLAQPKPAESRVLVAGRA